MLPRQLGRCALPLVSAMATSTSVCAVPLCTTVTRRVVQPCTPSRPAAAAVLIVPPVVLPDLYKTMPTPLLDAERLPQHECGTGNPAQRGRRRVLGWRRRKPWFNRQWTLDLLRQRKGPETPQFPDGVPFTQIRAFQSFAGRSWKVNVGRRRKIRYSLKRGRRKLL